MDSSQIAGDFQRFSETLLPDIGFAEIRCISSDGAVERTGIPVRDALRFARWAADRIGHFHIYCGVATRRKAAGGGKDALLASQTVWADVDARTPDAVRFALSELKRLEIEPAAVIRSGTGAGFHLYIRTEPRLLSNEAERRRQEELNRRLCLFIGGDRACCDASRIMRLPGTLNIKHKPAAPVKAIYNQNIIVYEADWLLSRLPAPADVEVERPSFERRSGQEGQEGWLRYCERWAQEFHAPVGERHRQLVSWSAWFARRGAPYSIVAPAVICAGLRTGLPIEEIERILKWSYRSTGT